MLPPPDHRLSPRTGWTRAHWAAVADHLVDGVLRYRSPAGALVRPPGRVSCSGELSDGLEGYARSFLLAAARVAGAQGADERGWLTGYAEGLAAGTADTDERWPAIVDRSQPLVEAASLVIGLRLTKPWLWDRLDEAVRQRVVEWLRPALRVEHVDNNWWLFAVMVADFLADVGAGSPQGDAVIRRGLDRVESFYVGDGWYSDGPNRAFDYYNGWAMHFYLGLRTWLFGLPAGPELRDRLRTFLSGYAGFFDGGGGMVYFGRSLTYRFASAAPLWLGAALDASPWAPGQTRATASAMLQRFLDRGAVHDGLLTTGWYGPHEPTLQPYSGAASPYWAAKGFLGLALPADHPVWRDPEPDQGDPGTVTLDAPGFVLHGHGGIARLVNHGSHTAPGDPLYERLAYSSRTGPTAQDDSADNHFALLIDGGWTIRGAVEPLGSGPGWAASRHVPAPGTAVDSVSVVRDDVEVRVHRVDAPEGTRCRQTGWAVAGGEVEASLVGLLGYDRTHTITVAAGTAFGAPATVAALDGAGDLLACAVVLRPVGGAHPDQVQVDRVPNGVAIRWWDGAVRHVTFTDRVRVSP
ncbi:DUF2264 domain-containing protein [Actinokineospora sp. HUAS TT18]|uniref:DUF2264 domain-containing protein n=1 Tax=Actinokineospora sp. HUAS TT18 TaxID=3447451 RepID=UPI003F525328